MKRLLLILCILLPTVADEYFYEFGEKVFLKEAPPRGRTRQGGIRHFETKQGFKMTSTGEIIVKLQNFEHLSYFLKTYPIDSYKKLDQRTFLLKPERGYNVFTIANKIHTDTMSIYAHPNFIREKRGNR